MRTLLLATVLAFGLPSLAFPQVEAPKPPEYQRLDYFVGTWRGEGTQHGETIGSPSGRWSGTMACSPFAGGFTVVCDVRATIGETPYREMAILGYDPEERTYTWFDVDSTGMNALAHGSLQGDRWTFLFEMKAGGKVVKLRVALVQQAPIGIANTADASVDGGPWIRVIDAKFTKSR